MITNSEEKTVECIQSVGFNLLCLQDNDLCFYSTMKTKKKREGERAVNLKS